MTNSTKQPAQNASANQSAHANTNAMIGASNAATYSNIEQSMNEYGTYTATSDANNEYPPKNQAGSNIGMASMQNVQSNSSAQQNSQNTGMTNSVGNNAVQSSKTNGSLTAQYDANGKA